MIGTVSSVVPERGFAFAKTAGVAYFIHRTACAGFRLDDLRIGDLVQFDEQPSDRGPRATNVRRVA